MRGLLTERVRGLLRRWIDARTGRRSDVPHYFIYNQTHNERLHVVTSVHVNRVLLECVFCLSSPMLSFADREWLCSKIGSSPFAEARAPWASSSTGISAFSPMQMTRRTPCARAASSFSLQARLGPPGSWSALESAQRMC